MEQTVWNFIFIELASASYWYRDLVPSRFPQRILHRQPACHLPMGWQPQRLTSAATFIPCRWNRTAGYGV